MPINTLTNITSKPLLFLALTFCTASVFAHHGVTQHYDPDSPVSLTAVVTKVEFVNPHAYLYFDVADENGESAAWRCEMSAATNLKRRGWNEDTLKAGQNITVNGSLARREERVCAVSGFVLDDGLEVSRMANVSELNTTKEETPAAPAGLSEEERIAMATRANPDFSGNWIALGVTFRSRVAAQGGAAMGGAMGMAGGGGGGGNNNGGNTTTATEAGLAAGEGYDANFDNPNLHCRASDIIMAIQRDSHANEFIQGEDIIELKFGYMNVERTVYMNMDSHPDNIAPSLEGHSIGSWQGPALVIDTVGFLPSTYGGSGNYMTSEQMHITERFEFDAAENQLLRKYTVEDPLYINGTITGTQNLVMTDELYEEYGCKELSGSNNQRS